MDHTKFTQLPIGVFDSGVGGLTVLRELQQALPQESFLYLGDTARLPYGTKSPTTIIRYAQQASQILYNRGIKLLVVACNTASALALPALKQQYTNLPVIGVLEPGAHAACLASRSGHIAVIATEATVNAGGYQNAIKKIRPDARVTAQSCGLFVALAEEGWLEGPETEAVARRYLGPLLKPQLDYIPDCLVLGSTHFPTLLRAIKNVVHEKIAVIDSAKTTALVVTETLQLLNLHNVKGRILETRFLVTDAPTRFAKVAELFLGGGKLSASEVELVELQSGPLP